METRRFTLPKEERISWQRHLDMLFAQGESFIAYPLRVVYLPLEEPMPARVAIMVSVPKKKFKRAVKRNLIKRQVREVYRLQKYEIWDPLTEKGRHLLVAFLYLDKEIHPAFVMEKAMRKAMGILKGRMA